MRQTSERHIDAADHTVKNIRSKARKRYSPKDKIRIVLAHLRGEDTITELCRQEGIAQWTCHGFMLLLYVEHCQTDLRPRL